MSTPYDPYPRDGNDSATGGPGQGGGYGSQGPAGPYGPYGPYGAEAAASGPYGTHDVPPGYGGPSGYVQDGVPPHPGPYGYAPQSAPYGYAPAAGPYPYPPAPGFVGFAVPGPAPATAGEAVSRAFTLFSRHGGVLIAVIATWGAPLFILAIMNNLFGWSAGQYRPVRGSFAVASIVYIIYALVAITAQVSLASGALRLVRTGRVSYAEFFILPRTWWQYALAVGVVTSLVTFIPSSAIAAAALAVAVVVAAAIVFAPFHLADAPRAPLAAFAASARTVVDNLGQTILLLLICAGLYLAGAVVCGLGLLVAVPVITLSLALFYCGVRREIVAP